MIKRMLLQSATRDCTHQFRPITQHLMANNNLISILGGKNTVNIFKSFTIICLQSLITPQEALALDDKTQSHLSPYELQAEGRLEAIKTHTSERQCG